MAPVRTLLWPSRLEDPEDCKYPMARGGENPFFLSYHLYQLTFSPIVSKLTRGECHTIKVQNNAAALTANGFQ